MTEVQGFALPVTAPKVQAPNLTMASSASSERPGYRLIDGSKAYYRFSDIMFEASRRG
jgi:hypothetical protein